MSLIIDIDIYKINCFSARSLSVRKTYVIANDLCVIVQ